MLGTRAGLWAALALTLAACGGGNEGEGGTAAQDTTRDETTTEIALPEVEEPPPSAKQLLGTWSRIGSSTLFRFNRDGTFDVDTHRLDDPLYATGPYELDGSTLIFTASGPACADEWEWQIGIVKAEIDRKTSFTPSFRTKAATCPRAPNSHSREFPSRARGTSRTPVAHA